MAGRNLNGMAAPTPGPWLVQGEAGEEGSLGADPLGGERVAVGGPYFVRQDRAFAPGGCVLDLATGIRSFADARLMAAAPDLAAALLRLLTSPALTVADLDPQTHEVLSAGWDLVVRVAPHLELWAEEAPSPLGRH